MFFIVGHTFAAPFVSEEFTKYSEAESAGDALTELAEQMRDHIGLFAGAAYANADAYHKGQDPIASWRSNKALALEGASSVYSEGPGKAEIDGKATTIEDPKGGRLI